MMTLTDTALPEGASVFLRDGKSVFHTYSTCARGADLLIGTFNYLDLTPLGRQEEPSGRSDGPFMHWVRRHDRYGSEAAARNAASPGIDSCCDSGAHRA